jgi:hypothetical protein
MDELKTDTSNSTNTIDEDTPDGNVLELIASHGIQRPPVPIMNWDRGEVGWESEDDVANPQ